MALQYWTWFCSRVSRYLGNKFICFKPLRNALSFFNCLGFNWPFMLLFLKLFYLSFWHLSQAKLILPAWSHSLVTPRCFQFQCILRWKQRQFLSYTNQSWHHVIDLGQHYYRKFQNVDQSIYLLQTIYYCWTFYLLLLSYISSLNQFFLF